MLYQIIETGGIVYRANLLDVEEWDIFNCPWRLTQYDGEDMGIKEIGVFSPRIWNQILKNNSINLKSIYELRFV